jgi:hypothetical protein
MPYVLLIMEERERRDGRAADEAKGNTKKWSPMSKA